MVHPSSSLMETRWSLCRQQHRHPLSFPMRTATMTDPQSKEKRVFPIQTKPYVSEGRVPEAVYMAAYEVYSAVYGAQPAMIDLEGRNCRGGFGTGELVAFLYARGFPREQWRHRVDQAFDGMDLKA